MCSSPRHPSSTRQNSSAQRRALSFLTQVILDAFMWKENLPDIIMGVFYPVPGGDRADAERVRAEYTAAFSISPDKVPLLTFDPAKLDAPFVHDAGQQAAMRPAPLSVREGTTGPGVAEVRSPAVRGGIGPGVAEVRSPAVRGGMANLDPLAAATQHSTCDVVLDSGSKFWHMWGTVAWQKTYAHEKKCWGKAEDAKMFFAEVAAGTRCDSNWYEGAEGTLGDQYARPEFLTPAPALFGFDEALFAYCSKAVGGSEWFNGPGNFNNVLAHKCVQANQNILRLLSARAPWSMCQNLRWTMCAISGLLPGQPAQKQIHFATAPNALTLTQWYEPDSWPCVDGSCPEGKFAVGDVFFVEVCLISRLCRNGADLFSLAVGETMVCDFDPLGFDRLATQLQAIE